MYKRISDQDSSASKVFCFLASLNFSNQNQSTLIWRINLMPIDIDKKTTDTTGFSPVSCPCSAIIMYKDLF